MSDKEKIEVAKKYVDEQIRTMKEHGAVKGDIPAEDYDRMVKKVSKVIICK